MINNTLTTYWDEESKCFVTQSKEYDRVIGCAQTEEESQKIYFEHLERFLKAQKQNKLAKVGRPPKDNKRLNCHIPANIRDFINFKCKEKNIKQGQFITELVEYYKTHC